MSILGIDLGTTLNKVACFNPYGLRITINNNKSPATPSVAFADKKDRWVFGEKAVKRGISKPKQCIYETKLMLGRKFEDPFIQKRRKLWKFETKPDEEGRIKIVIKIYKQTKEYYAYEILGKILQNLVEVANINLPAKTRQVVISIPYSFNQQQIDELILATNLAQLQVIRFVTEPVSTTLAYLHNLRLDVASRHNFLIYDVGTSSINAFIIKTYEDPQKNEIISKTNYEINGQTFEEKIYEYLIKEKINKKLDPKTELKLRIACKESKTILSEVSSTDIIIEDEEEEEEENGINITLTEEEFNKINEKLFEESMKPVKEVIEESKINKESIEQIFLVGGSTYMRELRTRLKKITGKEACTVVDPRESVALGCCIEGSTFSVDEILESLESEKKNFEPIKNILPEKQKFFQDLEIFSKFDKEIEISFGSRKEIIVQENQQIPCIIEQKFEIDNECKQIEFFEKDSQKSFYQKILQNPISGPVKLNIKITLKKNEQHKSTIQFHGILGSNKIDFELSKPSNTIIYKEYIKQAQEIIDDESAQILKKPESNLISQESAISTKAPSFNALEPNNNQNGIKNIIAESNFDAYHNNQLFNYSYSSKQFQKLEKEIKEPIKDKTKDKQQVTGEKVDKTDKLTKDEQQLTREKVDKTGKLTKDETKDKQQLTGEKEDKTDT